MRITGRNVNVLYAHGLAHLSMVGEKQSSRVGDVIVAPWPVLSVYDYPTERVLFDENRNANPFFHLMEGLWMLAGRDDAAFLNHYIKDFGERFAEDGLHIHGAYGHRWRRGFSFDQLDVVVWKLKKNPNDRQCVIQMWDGRPLGDDVGFDDLCGDFKDRPCNTHVYLRVRNGVLDLTVCCRSNDIIMGAYGANAVHFSMLHEYLAGRIGVGVGYMYQFSNNFHAYVRDLDRVGEPPLTVPPCPYDNGQVWSVPMAEDWSQFDEDLKKFMSWHDFMWRYDDACTIPEFTNVWFERVAYPVALSNRRRVKGDLKGALDMARVIEAPDWRRACSLWIARRMEKKQ